MYYSISLNLIELDNNILMLSWERNKNLCAKKYAIWNILWILFYYITFISVVQSSRL